MKAMLLAAGEGRRLHPFTTTIPKPMIPVAGRPILEHNISLLTMHGIREIAVNVHHCAETVMNALGDGRRWGARITYSFEPALLGTAGAVAKLSKFFDETFLVMYGDNLSTCDLTRLAASHRRHSAAATMALYHRDDPTGGGIVALGDDDAIVRFAEKPGPDQLFSHWVNAGLLVLEPSVLRFIPEQRPADFSYHVFPALLAAREPVYGYRFGPHEELWWIDTPEALARVQELPAETFRITRDGSTPEG